MLTAVYVTFGPSQMAHLCVDNHGWRSACGMIMFVKPSDSAEVEQPKAVCNKCRAAAKKWAAAHDHKLPSYLPKANKETRKGNVDTEYFQRDIPQDDKELGGLFA